jgi:acetyltransferase-like isoleucine patch superfamily enzyme
MPHEMKGSHLLKTGEGTYGAENITIHYWDNRTKIAIGKYCSIADNVHVFLGGNHDVSNFSTFPFGTGTDLIGPRKGHPETRGHIKIGNDVWVGSYASIISGVTIGNGAVIAAFAHVVRDVADYEVVGGNPAKHIKFRFSQEIIDQLMNLQWWDWPHEKVMKARDMLCTEPKLEQLKAL